MLQTKSLLPFGAVTIALVAVTMLYSWWHKDDCHQLEASIGQGYFLRWAEPQLLLMTASKETFTTQGDSKGQACQKMMATLNERTQP